MSTTFATDTKGRATQQRHPDPDELDRVLDCLAGRHGNLQVTEPDFRGTVRVFANDGAEWRFTADDRLIVVRRAQGGRV